MTASVLVPLVTPLGPGGGVVEDDVRRLVESLGEHVQGFMPALSSGEGWRLCPGQWEDMVAATCRYSGELPVYAGVELPTTDAVIERSTRATTLGVDAIVATTPFRPQLEADAVVDHFRAIAQQAGPPLFVYNESALSGNTCDPATLVRCCKLPGVMGVKESSGSVDVAAELVNAPVAAYQGWEHLIGSPPGMAGCAVGLANIEPLLCWELAASSCPSARRGVLDACQQHRLFEDDWYRHLKVELVRRGILTSSRTVGSGEEGR